jgi:hypothetical protein
MKVLALILSLPAPRHLLFRLCCLLSLLNFVRLRGSERWKGIFSIASYASQAADWLRDGPKEAASNPEMAEAAE